MLIAHLRQQPGTQDARVAQWPPGLQVTSPVGVQLQAPFTKTGGELCHQPPLSV